MSERTTLRLVNDHDLETDLAEFGLAIVREIYLAARKFEGPEMEFSAVQRVLDRPLSHLRKWFRLLRVADLERSDGLRLCGIQLPETAFTTGLGRLLQERGVEHLVIVPPVATPELHALLRALALASGGGTLAEKLQARGVRCVQVNDTEWRSRLAHRPVPKVEADGQVRLLNYVSDNWSHLPDLVCAAAAGGLTDSPNLSRLWHCYVTPQVLEAVLSKRFAALPSSAILDHARTQLEAKETAGETAPARPPASYWQGLLSAVADHPYGYELTRSLKDMLAREELPIDVDALLDSHVRARFEATAAVDGLTSRIFSTACTVDDLKSWGPVFVRLLKSGPSQRTAGFLEALLLNLKRDDRDARRKAHFLLGRALAAASATEDPALTRWLAERLLGDLAEGVETYEFSDLLAGAGELLAASGQWDVLSTVAARLRAIESGTAPGRERTMQVVLERWRQPRWITQLFRAASEEQGGASAVALLTALGGRDVALQAAALITHSQRRVRLAMLELLSGMGDEALTVCEELVQPSGLWTQRKAGGLLVDEAWYTIRNTLHILGRVGQDRVLPILKRHAHDADSRVRLEIIRALERVGSQEARSMLVILAEDRQVEVKRAAVTALGTVGGEHEVFVIQELLRSDEELAECALPALGHLGGRAAKDFLFKLLDGDTSALPAQLASRLEFLRESALRALVQNPDSEIVAKIETFCRSTNRTFRIPLVTDPLSDSGRTRFDKTNVKQR